MNCDVTNNPLCSYISKYVLYDLYTHSCVFLYFYRCDEQNEVVDINGVAEYEPLVLSSNALRILDVALTTINNPKGKYVLSKNSYWSKPLDLIRIA